MERGAYCTLRLRARAALALAQRACMATPSTEPALPSEFRDFLRRGMNPEREKVAKEILAAKVDVCLDNLSQAIKRAPPDQDYVLTEAVVPFQNCLDYYGEVDVAMDNGRRGSWMLQAQDFFCTRLESDPTLAWIPHLNKSFKELNLQVHPSINEGLEDGWRIRFSPFDDGSHNQMMYFRVFWGVQDATTAFA